TKLDVIEIEVSTRHGTAKFLMPARESRWRVLSGDPDRYGAANPRVFTIYENFSGKIVSVLLEYNFLFFLILHP
ncbi:hypothetical protein, partial [Escherichia coli]|uniref:hypothetical protein n=1 Tax=Escherichia coli TaxID=562 RepID=UPI001BB29626